MKPQAVIYFDTEFTCFEQSELLSIGAVSLKGKEFYAEVDPIPFGACSDFVKAHVLPKFAGPAFSKGELASRFLSWLGGFEKDVLLMSDSHYDRDLVNSLCGGYPFHTRRLSVLLAAFIQLSGKFIAQINNLLARRKQMKQLGSRLLSQNKNRGFEVCSGASLGR